jgi:hypothetical protein
MTQASRESTPVALTIVQKDGSTAQSYGVARGYLRPQFGAGNFAAVKHGAYSEHIISTAAVEVGKELLEDLGTHFSRLAKPKPESGSKSTTFRECD